MSCNSLNPERLVYEMVIENWRISWHFRHEEGEDKMTNPQIVALVREYINEA